MRRFQTLSLPSLFALAALVSASAQAPAAPIEWKVRGVTSDGASILTLGDAENLLSGSIPSKTDVTGSYPVINFNEMDRPTGELFPAYVQFPGTSAGNETDFAVEATANVAIPKAGAYTFGVSSDDGFGMTIGSNKMAYPNLRSAGVSYATFIFSQPGAYPVDLIFYQHKQYAELELFATSGTFTTFNQKGADFKLIGATGGLALASSGVSSPVPEPGGIVLLAPVVMWLLARRIEN